MENLVQEWMLLHREDPEKPLGVLPSGLENPTGASAASASPGQILWAWCITSAAVQLADWENHGTQTLFHRFCAAAEQYLHTFYKESAYTEEWIRLLPPMARFGRYCIQAKQALAAGDEVGYVRCLRDGVKTVPAMKGMTAFLIREGKRRPKQESPAELFALAEKIRAILAQYPPEDPAVAQLKQTPAYKTVAHLIEDPGSEVPLQ